MEMFLDRPIASSESSRRRSLRTPHASNAASIERGKRPGQSRRVQIVAEAKTPGKYSLRSRQCERVLSQSKSVRNWYKESLKQQYFALTPFSPEAKADGSFHGDGSFADGRSKYLPRVVGNLIPH